MIFKKAYITLFGLLISLPDFSQPLALRKIGSELSGIFQAMLSVDYSLRFDSLLHLNGETVYIQKNKKIIYRKLPPKAKNYRR